MKHWQEQMIILSTGTVGAAHYFEVIEGVIALLTLGLSFVVAVWRFSKMVKDNRKQKKNKNAE